MDQSIISATRSVAFCSALIGCPGLAAATALPNADNAIYSYVVFGVNSSEQSTPINTSGAGTEGTYVIGESALPDPTVSITTTNLSDNYGEAVMEYDFEVVGPTSPATIPLDILVAGNLTADTASDTTANSGVNVAFDTAADDFSHPGTSVIDYGCGHVGPVTPPETLACGQFSSTPTENLLPDTVYVLFLEAGAGGGSAFALADPSIYLDPTFADADQYSIVLSSGVGNPPPSIPEPSTLTLLGGAIAAFGSLRQRKKAA